MESGRRNKGLLALLLAAALLMGCTAPAASGPSQYQATFLTLFDTVTTIVGYGETEEDFRAKAQEVHDALLEYHQLFDIYNDYEGINNLKTINDQAGVAPVEVDSRIIALLLDCKEYYEFTDGLVNVAMGSVLNLWHEARTDGINFPDTAALPDDSALEEAALHCSFDTVLIDEEASTVFLTDPQQRLDVGAIAKGWSVEQVCRSAPEGLLVSVGGNVCATGPKPSGAAWVVGIQSPDEGSEQYLHTLNITQGCVVTSGDYQRYYVVDGVRYHHIIDPETCYPSQYWRSVTVVCEDSGLADCLSTALFLLPQEQGQALLDAVQAEAMWVDAAGNCYYSPGFETLIRT